MREEPETKRRTIRDGYVAPTGQPERPRRLNDEKLTKIVNLIDKHLKVINVKNNATKTTKKK